MEDHRRTAEGQDIQHRLGLWTPAIQVMPPPAMIPRSRDEPPQHSDLGAASTRPQLSLGSGVFSTPNVQGAHMILRSFPELDPVNSLTLMVNQLKTLLDAA